MLLSMGKLTRREHGIRTRKHGFSEILAHLAVRSIFKKAERGLVVSIPAAPLTSIPCEDMLCIKYLKAHPFWYVPITLPSAGSLCLDHTAAGPKAEVWRETNDGNNPLYWGAPHVGGCVKGCSKRFPYWTEEEQEEVLDVGGSVSAAFRSVHGGFRDSWLC